MAIFTSPVLLCEAALRCEARVLRLPPAGSQQRLRPLHDIFDGEAQLSQDDLARRRGAVPVQGNRVSPVPDVALPAQRGAGFDGEARADPRRDDRLAVLARLPVEEGP